MASTIGDVITPGNEKAFTVRDTKPGALQDLAPQYKKLLSDPVTASLTTLSEKGEMQVTPVWVGNDGTYLELNSVRGRLKDRNLRRNGKVTLLFMNPANPYHWMSINGKVGQAVGTPVVTDMAHIAGLVAAKVHPSPVPHSDFVTTTTHKTLRGPRGGLVLCRSKYAKDLDRALFPGVQGGPLMHIVAAKAVCLKEALEPGFADYQRQIVKNAQRLAAGLVSAGFRLVSGGTDNHLMLVDVFSKGLTGKVAEAALGKASITVNKNAIPFDKNPPMVASGIRLGTPAVTSRGMGEPEMDLVADYIARALAGPEDDAALAMVRTEVEALCRKFPLYPEA